MRKIGISNCEPGMILGRTIFYNGATILLETGAILTASYLDRLKELGITEIYVEDNISDDLIINDVVKEETRLEAIEFVKNTMDSYSPLILIDSNEIIAVVHKILDDILTLDEIIVNLMDIKTCDMYTFSHCVNVCILSIMTGVKLELSDSELMELGVGALMHDIGKVMVPPEILKKKSALTEHEYQIIKQHSIYGYNILKTLPLISEASARVALDHHERYDGKGYPSGLLNDQIHIYSRIVAITDTFDALTSDRIYRDKISTNQAIEYLTMAAAPTFDSRVLNSFAQIVPPYPIGTAVILNTGEKGVVIKINKNLPTRPVIRVVFSSDGRKKAYFEEIDLAERTGHVIITNTELIK